MVTIADAHSSNSPIWVTSGITWITWSPASPASRKPIATSCTVVFHLASLVTGTLTRRAARYSRKPDTRISRHRITIAAHSEHPAECRLLVPDPRVIAVEIIRDAGGDEHGDRHPAQPERAIHDRLRIDAADYHRDGGDARIGQDIRQRERTPRRHPGRCNVHSLYQYRCRRKVNR